MGATSIQWTNVTWNPVRGCSRVSPGCDHCYAIRQAHRQNWKKPADETGEPAQTGNYYGLTTIRRKRLGGVNGFRDGIDWTGIARFVPEMLDAPLRVRTPKRWFVNSMSDLFHHSVTDEQIDRVFAIMALARWHTFQVLTKRAERMASYTR